MAWRLRTRGISIWAVGFACVLVAAIGLLFCSKNKINIDIKIEGGMTEREITALIGGPPLKEDEKNPDDVYYYGGFFSGSSEIFSSIDHVREWRSGEGALQISFDKEGKVVFVTRGTRARPPTLVERIRDFLRSLF